MKYFALLSKNKVELHFRYNTEMIGLIKNDIPGRKWEPRPKKCWTAPLSKNLFDFLDRHKFKLDPSLEEKRKQWVEQRKNKKQIKFNLPNDLSLYKFQKIGIQAAIDFENNALIADDMGLGKTIQALAWLSCQPNLRPALIIPPATVKINWYRKANLWLKGENITLLSGIDASKDIPKNPNIIICNYDILEILKREKTETKEQYYKRKSYSSFLHHALKDIEFKALILDEGHYIGNQKARRTKIVRSIGRKIDNKLILTGTPITSRPSQFFTILNLLKPELFPSFWQYAQKYCGAKHTKFGWDFSGASNIEELNSLLTNNIMIRRTKKDVIKDLPEKLRDIVPLEIDNTQQYIKAENDFIKWLQDQGKTEKAQRASKAVSLSRIEGLKQLCLEGKRKSTTKWIQNFLDDGNNKLVIFCHHTQFRKQLYEKFKTIAVEATGGAANQKAEDIFQNDPNIRLFIGGIKSANVGLTLTASSHMAIVELPLTPGDLEQAENRIYARLNDMHGANIYLLIAEKTIEEDIAELLDKKTKIISKLIDGKKADEGSLITELLDKYRRKNDS